MDTYWLQTGINSRSRVAVFCRPTSGKFTGVTDVFFSTTSTSKAALYVSLSRVRLTARPAIALTSTPDASGPTALASVDRFELETPSESSCGVTW